MAESPPVVDLSDARTLVVVKPSSLGDVVHALPVLRFLKRDHPRLTVSWVVNTEWLPLLAGNPDLRATIDFPRRGMRGISCLWKVFAFRRELRRSGRPDIVLDLQGLLRSALIGRALRPDVLVGMSDAREGACGFYDRVVEVDGRGHAVDRYLAVARALGVDCPSGEVRFPLPENVGECPPLPQRFVLLHPYSRGRGKALSPEHVRLFCQSVAPGAVVIVGVAGEDERPADLPSQVVDLTNRTSLNVLIEVMRRAGFIVSVDSGPMHLAAAVDAAKLLGIHTWSNPRRVGPYPPGAHVWKAGRIARCDSLSTAEAEADSTPEDGDIEAIADFAGRRVQG